MKKPHPDRCRDVLHAFHLYFGEVVEYVNRNYPKATLPPESESVCKTKGEQIAMAVFTTLFANDDVQLPLDSAETLFPEADMMIETWG